MRNLNGECADDEELRKRISGIADMANGSGRMREGVVLVDRGP
jgi:hypothetical protein